MLVSSRFSRRLVPLGLTMFASATVLSTSAIRASQNTIEQKENETELFSENLSQRLLENDLLWGSILGISALGSAACLTLAGAVNSRHKKGPETIDELFDVANLKEEDYKKALDLTIKEYEEAGIKYDLEELQERFKPRTKEETNKILENMGNLLLGVTLNTEEDKNISRQIKYLVKELQSAVKYGYDIENDEIKIKLHYFYDMATTPEEKWQKKEAEYQKKYPEINFEMRGSERSFSRFCEDFFEHEMEYEISKTPLFGSVLAEQNYIKNELLRVKKDLLNDTENMYWNRYDKRACLRLVDEYLNNISDRNNMDARLSSIMNLYNMKLMRKE